MFDFQVTSFTSYKPAKQWEWRKKLKNEKFIPKWYVIWYYGFFALGWQEYLVKCVWKVRNDRNFTIRPSPHTIQTSTQLGEWPCGTVSSVCPADVASLPFESSLWLGVRVRGQSSLGTSNLGLLLQMHAERVHLGISLVRALGRASKKIDFVGQSHMDWSHSASCHSSLT